MGKTLIIAEKPSVAREIASALGSLARTQEGWLENDSLVISSGIGHLVEIHAPEADSAGYGLNSLPIIPKEFALRPIGKTKDQFNLLKKLMSRKDVACVVNACDAGREGELIFRLIYDLAGCAKPTKRMWLQSMTEAAIRDAYAGMRPGVAYDNLRDAAVCRSEADWIIGINGSRGLTSVSPRESGGMNAGRVQTPTLAILVRREAEITGFVSKPFWEITADFRLPASGGEYVGKWIRGGKDVVEEKTPGGDDSGSSEAGGRLPSKGEADAIVARCKGVNPSSVSDDVKNTRQSPPLLFDLTTLQREANKKFKMSAKATLEAAQSLYEKHKALSYPRTDSTALPEDYIGKAKSIMGQLAGSALPYAALAGKVGSSGWIVPDKRIFNDAKISDHFAIIPTGVIPSGLDPGEAEIYEMVAKRFVAAFFPAAEFAVTTRISVVATEMFRTTGKVPVKIGWMEVYGGVIQDGKDAVPTLCPFTEGDLVETVKVSAKESKTKPPPRMTEAALLAAMEGAGKLVEDDELRSAMKERGLGTPATRAATIEGLLSDKTGSGKPKEPYVTRQGKEQFLVPTPKGINLVEFLDANGIGVLSSPRMTGEWEYKLRQMEQGKYSRETFMGEVKALTEGIIRAIKTSGAAVASSPRRSNAPSGGNGGGVHIQVPCPKCGGQVVLSERLAECAKGCGFRLWRTVASRMLSDGEIESLLRDGSLPELTGFVSKADRTFSAGLRLEKEKGDEGRWGVSFVFKPR